MIELIWYDEGILGGKIRVQHIQTLITSMLYKSDKLRNLKLLRYYNIEWGLQELKLFNLLQPN